MVQLFHTTGLCLLLVCICCSNVRANTENTARQKATLKTVYKVDVSTNTYTANVQWIGQLPEGQLLKVITNELQELKNIRYRNVGEKKWNKVRPKKVKHYTVPGKYYYNGVVAETFRLPKQTDEQTTEIAYEVEAKEVKTLCFLPFSHTLPTDSFFYEVWVPEGYTTSFMANGEKGQRYPYMNHATASSPDVNYSEITYYSATPPPFPAPDAKPSGLHVLVHRKHMRSETMFKNWYMERLHDASSSLTGEHQDLFQHLFESLPSDEVKIKKAVDYIQQNVRYLAFEPGMDAFIPNNPSTVLERRYGDCKDLHFLLQQVLKEAGIKAYLGLCATRDYPYESSLTSLQSFNHLVCVVELHERLYTIDLTQANPFDFSKLGHIFLIARRSPDWFRPYEFRSLNFGTSAEPDPQVGFDHFEQIPPELQREDAVVLDSDKELRLYFHGTRVFTEERLSRRIQVLSERGIWEYGNIRVLKKDKMTLKSLEARTIKPNGEIVQLDKDLVKTEHLPHPENQGKTITYWKFPMPAVESGAIIEWEVIQKGPFQKGSDVHFFFDNTPILRSGFRIQLERDLILNYKNYNGLNTPEIKKGFDYDTYRWETQIQPGISHEDRLSTWESLPFLMYDLDIDMRTWNAGQAPQNWLEMLKEIRSDDLEPIIGKRKKIDRFYAPLLAASHIQSMRAFHQKVNHYFEVTNAHNIGRGMALEQFVESAHISPQGVWKLYRDFLETNNIPYYLAAGKARSNGPFLLDFPSRLQVDYLIFVVKDEQSRLHLFIPPSAKEAFLQNTFPPELEGTTLLLLPSNAGDHLMRLELPYSKAEENSLIRQGKGLISLERGKVQLTVDEKRSGHFIKTIYPEYPLTRPRAATFKALQSELVHHFGSLDLNSVYTNTLTQDQQPVYQIEYDFTYSPKGMGSDSDTVQLPLGQLVPLQVIAIPSFPDSLDYFYPFQENRYIRFQLATDRPVRLLDEEKLNFEISEGMIEFRCQVEQMDAQRIELELHLKCTVNRLDGKAAERVRTAYQKILGHLNRRIYLEAP